MGEKILVVLLAVFAYPIMWFSKATTWVADKLGIDPFYVVATVVVLPLWVFALLDVLYREPGTAPPVMDVGYLVVGGLFLGYVFFSAALTLVTKNDAHRVAAEDIPAPAGENNDGE